MSHFIEKYYKETSKPEKLLVFLHGYNGCIEDIRPALETLSNNLKHTLIIAPESEIASEKNPEKKQWYSLREFDPDDARRNKDTTLNELKEIYARYAPRLEEVALKINTLVDNCQKEHNIDNAHTIIAGFSQGGMLACYTALIRPEFNGRCMMFSSCIAGAPTLSKKSLSAPEFTFFHGREDTVVNYKTLEFSKAWLQDRCMKVKTYEYDNLDHKLIEPELKTAADIINNS